MNKKRYAGLLWTNAEKYDKMDAKGLETVRFEQARVGRRSYDRDVHLSVRPEVVKTLTYKLSVYRRSAETIVCSCVSSWILALEKS
jgi:hypothetical protein